MLRLAVPAALLSALSSHSPQALLGEPAATCTPSLALPGGALGTAPAPLSQHSAVYFGPSAQPLCWVTWRQRVGVVQPKAN